MKTNKVWALAVVILLSFTLEGIAQQKTSGPKHEKASKQKISVFTGTVHSWVNNEEYVFDGFYLQSKRSKYLVKFPTQMGSKLIPSIKTGDKISVSGYLVHSGEGEKEIKMESVKSGGKVMEDIYTLSAPTTPDKEFVRSNGRISELQKNKQGNVKNIILEDRTILIVPQDVVEQLNSLSVTGADITYSGMKRILYPGEVAADSYTLVYCETITVNGVQYVVR